MSDRLFDVEEYPEVPVLRPPRGRKGAAAGAALDARFLNDYPPEWGKCPACHGTGLTGAAMSVTEPGGAMVKDWIPEKCPECRGMGSVRARVRLDAGHRCERCRHPYIPKADAAMLGVERSWRPGGWSACDAECDHGGPIRTSADRVTAEPKWLEWEEIMEAAGEVARTPNLTVEAAWRVLTVHHLDGDKANLRWWNLAALCQRCHLEIQAKVVMERVYPHEHSAWFKPHAAGYYAWVYNGEELTREETLGRLDELLALELVA